MNVMKNRLSLLMFSGCETGTVTLDCMPSQVYRLLRFQEKLFVSKAQWCTPPPNAADADFFATPPPPKKTNGVIRRERYF